MVGWEWRPLASSRILITLRRYDDAFALAFARIEAHYFVNGIFLEDDHHENIDLSRSPVLSFRDAMM